MKKIILLMIILFVSGCSAEYHLEISNDSFKEKIKIIIDKSEIPTETYPEDVELDDQITPLIEKGYPVFFSNDKIYYKKDVIETTDYVNLDMYYNYNAKEFKNSNSLNLCFEDFEFYDDNNSYYIHAMGNFYCLYSESLNINIKTNNKVLNNNADSVNGNIYTWNINNDNVENVDIKFEVSKGIPYRQIFTYSLVVILIGSVVGSLLYFIIKKNKENNKI